MAWMTGIISQRCPFIAAFYRQLNGARRPFSGNRDFSPEFAAHADARRFRMLRNKEQDRRRQEKNIVGMVSALRPGIDRHLGRMVCPVGDELAVLDRKR